MANQVTTRTETYTVDCDADGNVLMIDQRILPERYEILTLTDYDVGLVAASGHEPVSIEEVFRVFRQNVDKVKDLILGLVSGMGGERTCACAQEAKNAVVG